MGGQAFTTVVRGFASFVLLDHVELAIGPGMVGAGVFAPAFRVLGLAGERKGKAGQREGFAFGATVSPLIVDSHAIWTLVGGLSYEVY
jgi:hypothetical protein